MISPKNPVYIGAKLKKTIIILAYKKDTVGNQEIFVIKAEKLISKACSII